MTVAGAPRLLPLIQYGVSGGLIALILIRADLAGAVRAVGQVRVSLFAAALGVMAFNMVVRSYKWQLLLRAQGVVVPLRTALSFSTMSMFFNALFLGSIGGDAFRVYRAEAYSSSRTGALSSILMERLTGLCAGLLLVLGLGAGFVLAYRSLVPLRLLAAVAVLAVVSSSLVVVAWKLHPRVLGIGARRLPRLGAALERLAACIRAHRDCPGKLLAATALSVVFHLAHGVTIYCFALAANARVPVAPLLFVAPLVAVLVMIPVSVNGLGIQEGSYILYLERLGVPGPVALLVAVLSRVAQLVLSLVGGLVFVVHGARGR
jgi:hypothetical protein